MFSFILYLVMLLAVAMSGSQAAGAGVHPADAEIVVSPEGSDAARGTTEEPVASLRRAQVLARSALADGHRVTVTLRGGVYRLAETLVLTQEDSGTVRGPCSVAGVARSRGGDQRRYAVEVAMGAVP